MPRAVIIRNIEGIQKEDLLIALNGMDKDSDAPDAFNDLLEFVKSNSISQSTHLKDALTLFKLREVRDYIFETVKRKTGSYVIYHLNGIDDNGTINEHNAAYISNKLLRMPSFGNFDMLYIGGGHGAPTLGTSNLNTQQLNTITQILKDKSLKFSSVILGSCFSAAYIGLYKTLLKPNSVTISNSLECGGDNNFHQTMEWLQGKSTEFYSEEDIQSSSKKLNETRSAIRRVLDGTALQGEKLKEYDNLLNAYASKAQEQLPRGTAEEIYERKSDLFNNDLNQIIVQMESKKGILNRAEIEKILKAFPLVHQHIDKLVQERSKKGERVSDIFDALVNSLNPTPTSLVIGTSNKLTMLNFNQVNEMPPNADQRFQENYRTVLNQIQQSDQSLEINQVQTLNVVSAKKQFNRLFIEATTERNLTMEEQSEAIDQLLNQFETDIKAIGTHYPNAKETADTLLNNLRARKSEAFAIDATAASLKTFAGQSQFLLQSAHDELQKDLGWGDYLANLAKEIINAVTTVIASMATQGKSKHHGFFVLKSSEAVQRANTLVDSLSNELKPK